MALTPDAQAALAADLMTRMTGGNLSVTDGKTLATKPIASLTRDGSVVTASVEFGDGEANFEWKTRRVISPDGWVMDELTGDLGRKSGSIWTLEVKIDVTAG